MRQPQPHVSRLQDYKHEIAQINTAEQIQQYTHPVSVNMKHELRNIPPLGDLPGAKRRQFAYAPPL